MHHDLHLLETEVTASLSGLSASQTQASPSGRPDKWSIQQIVEHLLLTYRATCEVIQARLERRRPTRATPTFAQRLAQFFIIALGRFPYGRSSPAAVAPSLPSQLRTGPELAHRVHSELARVDLLTTQAEALFGKGRSISHVILGPLSIPQWRRFHLVHGRHHVKQIHAIRREQAF